MTTVTVSPKFQIVIPKSVRDAMGIASGQKVQVITYKGRIELIPIKPISQMAGVLKGLDSHLDRDDDRL